MGGSSLLVSAFPWLYSCTSEAQKEVKGERARLGMIGTGSRGLYHINHLLGLQNVEIVALCDNHAPHLQNAAALCPKAKTFSNYEDLLELSDVDGFGALWYTFPVETTKITAILMGEYECLSQ